MRCRQVLIPVDTLQLRSGGIKSPTDGQRIGTGDAVQPANRLSERTWRAEAKLC